MGQHATHRRDRELAHAPGEAARLRELRRRLSGAEDGAVSGAGARVSQRSGGARETVRAARFRRAQRFRAQLAGVERAQVMGRFLGVGEAACRALCVLRTGSEAVLSREQSAAWDVLTRGKTIRRAYRRVAGADL